MPSVQSIGGVVADLEAADDDVVDSVGEVERVGDLPASVDDRRASCWTRLDPARKTLDGERLVDEDVRLVVGPRPHQDRVSGTGGIDGRRDGREVTTAAAHRGGRGRGGHHRGHHPGQRHQGYRAVCLSLFDLIALLLRDGRTSTQ